jgi:S-adenosylmethionine:tRNA ribosyltransferase-isomerase
MLLSDFDYHLPRELIATQPASPRDSARLLVLNPVTGGMLHRKFADLPEFLRVGDVLVLNDTKVFPARLIGQKPTGGKLEVFLLRSLPNPQNENLYECLVGGYGRGEDLKITFPHSDLQAEILKKLDQRKWLVRFNQAGAVFQKTLSEIGLTPLPPYIKGRTDEARVREEYQTIFARASGSVAAPTAGLHFTEQLLKKIIQQGVQVEYLTLHVGLGTFAPIKTENILEHKMEAEWANIPEEVVQRLNQAKAERRRIIAVGSTSARTLESFSCAEENFMPQLQSGTRMTDLYIYPSYTFKFVDALITNFHLPKSTLLLLVSALVDRQKIFQAYAEAIRERYRFYSFGDAMLIMDAL